MSQAEVLLWDFIGVALLCSGNTPRRSAQKGCQRTSE